MLERLIRVVSTVDLFAYVVHLEAFPSPPFRNNPRYCATAMQARHILAKLMHQRQFLVLEFGFLLDRGEPDFWISTDAVSMPLS